MSKYNVGDQVRIINERGWGWNSNGEMDKYRGKVLTISKVEDFSSADNALYTMEECPEWAWSNEDIAELVSSPAEIEPTKPTKPSEPEFKVGMKVRIKGDPSDYTDHLEGEIGTIVCVMNSDCRVTIDSNPDREWYIWNYNMTPVEEVTPTVEKVEATTDDKVSPRDIPFGFDMEIAALITKFTDDVLNTADKFKVDRREALEAVAKTIDYSAHDDFFWNVVIPMNDIFGKSAE